MDSWKLRRDVVPKLFNGGYREEILKLYATLLDDMARPLLAFDEDYRNCDAYAAELMEFLKATEEGLRDIDAKPGKPREKIPELKKWVAAELAKPKK